MVLRLARHVLYPFHAAEIRLIRPPGGFSKGTNSTAVPDWVDESVAGWIQSEAAAMDAAWGPAKASRGALAFVHIPPYAPSNRPFCLALTSISPYVQTRDPGVTARFEPYARPRT